MREQPETNREYKNYVHLHRHLGLRKLSRSAGEVKVVFFPFVGGQSLSFKLLAEALSADLGLWAVDPPGHGWAQGESITDFSALADLFFNELRSFWQGDFYLYGHSLGGLIVYRLAQIMEEAGQMPRGIFMGAAPVPHRIGEYEYLRRQSDEELIETMIGFGGIPENIARQRDFLLYYVNQIQTDIKVFLDCKLSRTPMVRTPLVIFYSKDDRFLPYENIFEWDIYGQNVSFAEVAGGHLFIQGHQQLVAARMAEFIHPNGQPDSLTTAQRNKKP